MEDRMKRVLTHLILSPLLIAVVAAALLAQENPPVPSPTMKVGDFLEFKQRSGARSRTEIVELLPNGLHAQSRDRFPGVRFIRDDNLTTIRIDGDFKGDAGGIVGWAFLNFPMHVGKRYSFNVVGAERIPFSVDMHVAALEDLRTEAGNLRSFRLDSCWKNNTSGQRDCGMTYWYAPTAKAIVKRETPVGWPKFLRDGDFEIVRANVVE